MAKRAPGAKPANPKMGRPAALKVDPERYPHVEKNPGLERALRIRQALDKGLPRDEAVLLADDAMGPRSPVGHAMQPEPKRRPSSMQGRNRVKAGRAATSPPRRRPMR